MVYTNKGDHDNPDGLPKDDSEGSQDVVHHDYAHIDIPSKMSEEIEKLEYICRATGMEEGPEVTLDIQCLR